MKLHLSLVERWRRGRGWVVPAALLAGLPKCALCLLAYAGLGGALFRTGPDLCGDSASGMQHVLAVSAGAIIGVGIWAACRRSLGR